VAAVNFLATIPSLIAVLTHSLSLCLTMLWVFIPLSYATFGPTFALVQNLVPSAMRSQAAALLLFLANVPNLIIAPQFVGWLSDTLSSGYGTDSLRLAMIPLGMTGFWAAGHYWLTARHLKAGLSLSGVSDAEPARAAPGPQAARTTPKGLML